MNKFIHYSTQAAFEADRAAGRISPNDIIFVRSGDGDSGAIYTHGTKFVGVPINEEGIADIVRNIVNQEFVSEAMSENLNELKAFIEETCQPIGDYVTYDRMIEQINAIPKVDLTNYYTKTEINNLVGGISPEIETASIQDIIDIFENRYQPSDAGNSGTTIDPHD